MEAADDDEAKKRFHYIFFANEPNNGTMEVQTNFLELILTHITTVLQGLRLHPISHARNND
jgi:hypothetical protein